MNMKNVIRFYAVGRAVLAEIHGGLTAVVAVCEFNDNPEKSGIVSYDQATEHAAEIAKLLTKNYPEE